MKTHACFTALAVYVLFTVSTPALGQTPRPTVPANSDSDADSSNSRESAECNSRFRTLDGTCTNPTDPTWSATSFTQFSYIEDHSSVTPSGENLPSPRFISNRLCTQEDDLFNVRGISEMTTFFGQLLDHDMIFTPLSEDELGIEIPRDDEIFGRFPGDVLPFERSMRGVVELGRSNERPINTVTSALDLSTVYGVDESRNLALREVGTCRLLVSDGNLLPFNRLGLPNAPARNVTLFIAGDTRSNEHPVLATLHTVFVREHNYICEELGRMMTFSSPDEHYETARLINGAQFQKIVYEEFIPAIMGSTLPEFQGFDPTANPTVSDVLGTAAFRIGHTMVGNSLPRAGPGNEPLESFPMEDMFFRSTELVTDRGIDEFMRGAMQSRAQEIDIMIHGALRNFLFTEIPEENGFDLIAINLQRSRDHVLPSFNEVRQALNLRRFSSFSELTSDPSLVRNLEEVYGTIDDMEPFIGLIAEDHIPGGSIGSTMAAVWRAEFSRLRDGDRFFYEQEEVFAGLQDLPMVRRLRQEGSILREILIRNTNITPDEIGDSPFFVDGF